MTTLRARCQELMRANPAFTREDVEAMIRDWDREQGKTSTSVRSRASELVRIVRSLPAQQKPRPRKPKRSRFDPSNAARHLGLVHTVIKRYRGAIHGRIELEDLVQEGLLGVLRAQETWDPEKGSFSTHAFYWIRARVTRYIQDKQRCVRVPQYLLHRGGVPEERVVRLDATYAGEGAPQHERVGELDPGFDQCCTRLELQRLLALIPDERQRSVISAHYVGGLTLNQVAEFLGVSRERARQLEYAGLDHIRRHVRRTQRLRGAA